MAKQIIICPLFVAVFFFAFQFCLIEQFSPRDVLGQSDSPAQEKNEPVLRPEDPDKDPEIADIKACLEDYIEGSTNGQPDRLRKAFHRDLNLYSIRNRKLSVWSGADYIADTKEGKPTGETGTIVSIDYENDTAMAKVEITPQRGSAFVDYFMLLKIEDRWTIVHKMYTRRNGSAARAEFPTEEATSELKEATAPAAQTKNEDPELTRRINQVLSAYDRVNEPGVAVAVIQNGKVVYQRAVGAANVEHQQPIDPAKTLFNIGSTSKQFTGFAVAILDERGELSLDDDVRLHIPELPKLDQKITLRNLAHHTSGLRSELSLLAMAGWSPGDVIRKRHIINVLKRQEGLNFNPGDQFDYSNSGFTLLAEVVERVSGKPFHQFCRDEIFTPMEMSNTQFSTGQSELRPNLANCYGTDSSGFFPRFPNDEYVGSTGLWTTCEDLAKWAANFQTRQFGSSKVWTTMLTPGRLNNGSSTKYSMGLFMDDYQGHDHIQHGGATSSYRSFLGHFPNDNLTIAVVSNSQAINAQALSLQIADFFLNDDANSTTAQVSQTESGVSLNREQLNRYSGLYWNRQDRTASVSLQQDLLVYSIDSGPDISLKPIGENKFEMVGVNGATCLTFEKRESGGYSIVIPHSDGNVNRLEPFQPESPTLQVLQDLAGRYYSSELDSTYTIRLDQGRLLLDHVRFQNVELIPVVGDVFRNDSWRFTTLHFERDQAGIASGFRIHSLRNRNLKFTRVADGGSTTDGQTNKQLSFEGMDAVAEKLIKQQHLPGLAVVVVENGETVFKQGYGLANVENQRLVDPDNTLFRIGSVSKALTFLVLTRLIDKGQLKPTDTVDQFIGHIGNLRGFEEQVTIDDLLMHTGGFDQIGTGRQVNDHHLSLAERKAKRIGLVEFLEANNLRRVSEAGEMFRYDTYGVTLAGAIIEQVTGRPFPVAMKQELFDPLGMTHSFVEADPDHFPNLAVGYGWQQEVFQPRPYEVYVTTPASSVDMTPSDMGLLMEALTNEGANANGRLLSKAMHQQVLSPQFRTKPEFVGITHGLFESYTSQESNSDVHLRTIGHGGSMDGYRCALTIIPEKNIGIFFVANRAPESGGGPVDFRPLLDLVVEQFVDAPRFKPFALSKQMPNEQLPPDELEEQLSEYAADYYFGIYCHTPTRDDIGAGAWRRSSARSVSVVNQQLLIGDETYLPYEKDVFVKSDRERLVHFGRNSKGQVTHFVYSTSPDTFEKEMPDLPYRQFTSLAQKLLEIASSENPEAAIDFLKKQKSSATYYISEREFNSVGYQLLEQNEFELAIEILTTNTQRFPDSWNAHDSLAEAYANAGEANLAIKYYEKSLQLNPNNDAGKQRLTELLKKN